MASRLFALNILRSGSRLPLFSRNVSDVQTKAFVRTIVYTESGALVEKPVYVRFGIIKVTCTVLPFLMTGAMISRELAALLEEHELFVPDDDDDD